MTKPKLIRITTVPISLEKLLEGQLQYMQQFYNVSAISSDKKRLEEFGKKNHVATYSLTLTRKITPLKDIRAVFKLFHFLRKERPLIVHTHTPKAGIVGMMAAYLAGVPIRLHTVAGLPLMEARGFKRMVLNLIEKGTYRFATNVYPNSQGLYDFILSERFTSKKKLSILANGSSNGIDISHFSPAHFSETALFNLRTKVSISPSDFVFLFVGRLVKDKGIVEVVDAFVAFQKKYSDSILLLVGPMEAALDPLPKATLDLIAQHPNIRTTGYIEDVRPYFAISTAFVFPSYREGFPNVVLQAASMKVPCIVSDIIGNNDIITHNVNGVMVPPKDTDALVKAMEVLYNNPELRLQFAEKSYENVTQKYERQQVWNALLKEYKRLEHNLL
ncbi:glycosyltransferase family 4 protein [Jejudonia soesokkakensis]|uniref:Glycosyltransferase family 4 protein n=1 Tax=Jejudonia soesokkakensis TaxID=1323432 RepID=A0ABW2MV24_9FLAO